MSPWGWGIFSVLSPVNVISPICPWGLRLTSALVVIYGEFLITVYSNGHAPLHKGTTSTLFNSKKIIEKLFILYLGELELLSLEFLDLLQWRLFGKHDLLEVKQS